MVSLSLHDPRPTAQHGRVRNPNGRSVHGEHGQDLAHIFLHFRWLSANLVKLRCKPKRLRKRGGMVKSARKRESLLYFLKGLIRISHRRGYARFGHVPTNSRIMAAILQGLQAMRFASIERNSLLNV